MPKSNLKYHIITWIDKQEAFHTFTVKDIAQVLHSSASVTTVSHTLRRMVDEGALFSYRDGRQITYLVPGVCAECGGANDQGEICATCADTYEPFDDDKQYQELRDDRI